MFEQHLEHLVESSVLAIPQAHRGLGLTIAVGFSFSLAHVFSLMANRLRPRQILVHVILDSLVLGAALLIGSFLNLLMIALLAGQVLEPHVFFNAIGGALAPGLFYVLVAAPYISDLIAIVIWFLVHLNVVTLVHLRFGLPYEQVLLITAPGYILTLVMVGLVFRQSWRRSYLRLASALQD
ncbi:MAG: hypothetical protein CBB79_04590 [Synechococcus sp. TMED19]|jgi:hypothetical protein|nr:MAG: hypothetical protein CBB79_04590 [Synechococcus sp. TMED19]